MSAQRRGHKKANQLQPGESRITEIDGKRGKQFALDHMADNADTFACTAGTESAAYAKLDRWLEADRRRGTK